MKTYTINMIQDEMNGAGSHWWDRDTMRYFRCRVGEQVYQGPGGIYFVTSEKGPHGPRSYSVRQYLPTSKDIETVGEFNSLSRSAAHRIASKLAATSRDEQYTAAMIELDKATTGKDKSRNVSKYGTAEAAANGEILYFSDGGYTRLQAIRYDDGSGFRLKLIPTGSKEGQERAKTAWNASYELQCEVCRVLATEPAGESAIVTAEVHKPKTDAEQLAIDIERNGGPCKPARAAKLIRLATLHHSLMESYRNGNSELFNEDGEPEGELKACRRAIRKLAAACGCAGVHFQGDPRGATVKLTFKNGETNDWGKEGWCVPTRD